MKNLYKKVKSFLFLVLMLFFSCNITTLGFAGNCPKRVIAQGYNCYMLQNLFIDNAVVDFPLITVNDKTVFQLVTGRSGELLIDGNWLNAAQIASFIKKKLGIHNNISYLNIYGCNFGKGRRGREAVRYLEKKLKMHIAASANITGSGGDWTLEVGVPKNSLHPRYAHNLQASCYTAGTNQGSIYINYYRLAPSPAVSEATSFDAAPNFSGVDPVTGYPTNSNTPTPPHSGTIESASNGGFTGYTVNTTNELYIIDIFISKKAMDCTLGFTPGYYEFRMKVTGFSRQVLFIDSTGSNSSINGDWRSRQVWTAAGSNPQYSDTMSIQVSNPTDWIFTKNYIIDATLNALYVIEYRHSSQSTFTTVPSAWVYPAVINNDICIKDSIPKQLTSSAGNTICQGQSSTLSGNCTMSGTTLHWYSDAALTTALPSNTVSPATTTTYYAACETSSCKSQSASITITYGSPSTPVVSNNSPSNICPASTVNLTTLTTASSGITYEWHSANNTNSNTVVANPAAVGVGNYYVFSKNTGNCYSVNAAQVSVSINSCSVPDTITMAANCATCSVTACPNTSDLPAGPRTYSSCSVPAGFTAGSPDTLGCITYTSTAPGNDTARTCIVACSGGVCDTSFFNILRTMVLPVTVTHFYGEKNKDGSNTLSWITMNEDGIQDYVIESSQDQINWKISGSKHALKKTGKLIYSVTDQTPYGHNFYRLKIFEENGNVQVFPRIIHLNNDLSEVGQMKVFPNPAQTTLNVQYLSSLSNATLQLTICDITGKKIYKFTHKVSSGNNTFPLDIAELDNGIYILNYHNAQNGVSGQIKFVKGSNQ